MTLKFLTASRALPKLADHLLRNGSEVGSRQGNRTIELLHQTIELTDPRSREILSRRASLPAQIMETMWVLSGRNDIAAILPYLPRAAEFSDDGETWRGGYGPRLRDFHGVDQLAHIVNTLEADRTSRRAVISIYDPTVDTEPGKDIPCNNWISFLNRNGKLDVHVAIRSNDLIWGWSGINAFEWSAVQEIVAGMLGIEVGSLVFSIASLHVYDRHWNLAKRLKGSADTADQAERGFEPSPRFRPTFGADMSALADLIRLWFIQEKAIREDPTRAHFEQIQAFPEPMLRSWLRVLAWWWSGDESYLVPLEGSRLAEAARRSPNRPGNKLDEANNKLADVVKEGLAGRRQLSDFSAYVSELHRAKDQAYGDSWKARGEMYSILPNIARKLDRLGKTDESETALDTATDLYVYLMKYQTWIVSTAGLRPDPAPSQVDRIDAMLRDHDREIKQDKARVTRREAYLRERGNQLLDYVAEQQGTMGPSAVFDRLGFVESMIREARRLAVALFQEKAERDAERDAWKARNATRRWNPSDGGIIPEGEAK